MKPDDVSQEAWDAAAEVDKKLLGGHWDNGDNQENIARAIMAAKDEEREACAKIAYREAEEARRNQCSPQSLGCLWVYDAIRSRK